MDVLLALRLLCISKGKVLPMACTQHTMQRLCLGQETSLHFIIRINADPLATNPEVNLYNIAYSLNWIQYEFNSLTSTNIVHINKHWNQITFTTYLKMQAPVETSAHTCSIRALEPIERTWRRLFSPCQSTCWTPSPPMWAEKATIQSDIQ